MLRNNANARRCSYFELGLPVHAHTSISFMIDVFINLACEQAFLVAVAVGR